MARLHLPLEKWFPSHDGWFYELATNQLWKHDSAGWLYFPYLPAWSRIQQFDAEGRTPEAKPKHKNLTKTVILQWQNCLILLGHAEIHYTKEDYVGIDKLIHSALAKDWQFQIQIDGSLNELRQDLKKSQGFAVSDGSF